MQSYAESEHTVAPLEMPEREQETPDSFHRYRLVLVTQLILVEYIAGILYLPHL